MKVEISGFKVKLGKKSFTLSLDEAKALFTELNKTFGPVYNYPTFSTYTPYVGAGASGSNLVLGNNAAETSNTITVTPNSN